MRPNIVKQQLREGKATVGSWLTLPDPVAALQMSTVGFDWLNIDLEHSTIDANLAAVMCQLIAQAGGTPLMRVAWSTNENVKKALDAGAMGLIFPMQNTRAQVEQSVALALYPPQGLRGFGPTLAVIGHETDTRTYFETINEQLLIVVQIEQVEAVENVDEILSVPGVDVALIGPNDLSASMGLSPFESHDDPRFIETVAHIRERCVAHGVAPGIYAGTPQIGRQRLDEGFRFVGVGDEAGHMLSGARAALAQLR